MKISFFFFRLIIQQQNPEKIAASITASGVGYAGRVKFPK